MWILSFLSPLFFSPLSFTFGVFGVIRNHPIISIPLPLCCFPPPITHCNTSFFYKSPLIALLCGCVWLGVFPPVLSSSSSPSFLGEGAYAFGARGGNSPARRGDRGETLLISRSADDSPVCAKVPQKYHSTNATGFYHAAHPFSFLAS